MPGMDPHFTDTLYRAHRDSPELPSPRLICDWRDGMIQLLFPALSERRYPSRRSFDQDLETYRLKLFTILDTLRTRLPAPAAELEAAFEADLPRIHAMLLADAGAILKGDPAAVNLTEVIRTYPGFYALAVYRLAHCFHRLGVPLVPRILTESAHNITGIDIHPGAVIGERFCIDHGTGLVIGGTAVIGDDVKVYQNVTLGALSVRKDEASSKRHPTIEDNVVIYSGATILGGNTVIGRDSVIGGNTWIVKSVPAGSKRYYKE